MPLGVGDKVRIGTNCGPVIPSDTIMFKDEVASLWVGGAGTVVIIKRDGTFVPFVGCQAGSYIFQSCIGVAATGTTATGINWII